MAKFGSEKLREQALDFIDAEFQYLKEEARGDSPIEKLLFLSIKTLILVGGTEYTSLAVTKTVADAELAQRVSVEQREAETTLICVPQAQIDDMRVDFVFSAFMRPSDGSAPYWRRLIVECDGHDFHERTKQQATRDKRRDRNLVVAGYDCFRFSGTEIWTDPLGCAQQIADWAVLGWFGDHKK